MIRFRRAAVLASLLLTGSTRAADWVVTDSDFAAKSIDLVGFSADGLKYKAGDSPDVKSMPMDRLIDVRRSGGAATPPAPRFVLQLSGGDRLVGEPTAVVGESMTWAEPTLGDVSIPFKRLVSLERSFIVPTRRELPKQDEITLNNGDLLAGVLTDVGGGSIKLQASAGPAAVPLNNVKRAAFASTGTEASAERGLRITLIDGTRLTASALVVDGPGVTVTLPGGATAKCRLKDVVGVEQINGPVAWLSGRQPIENDQRPFVKGAMPWPARFDTAVDGRPLQFEGRMFEHGIGVHAYSKLVFAVDPQWKSFRTQFAVSSDRESPRSLADMTVRIKVDDKVAFEQPHVRVGNLSPVQTIDLAGAKTLTLECDFGPTGGVQEHLNWLEPALLRGK